mgnify:CR=1 FL=1
MCIRDSATADRLVAATLAAWQQFDQAATPRLPRVLMMLFLLLSSRGIPLSDALLVLQNQKVRKRLLSSSEIDQGLIDEWLSLGSLQPTQFRDYVDSTSNRLFPFISSSTIRRMFGSTEFGVDIGAKLEKRSILLVNLAESRYFTRRSADLVGSLIVNEIVQHARLRKPDASRPFYVYIDECARFLNDDVVTALDETRKFGVHFVLAHQRFAALLKKGEDIMDAALDIQNKVVFGGVGAKDLELLAKVLFMGTIAFDEYIPNTGEAMINGYEWETTTSRSHSTTTGTSRAEGESVSEGESAGSSRSKSLSISHTPAQRQLQGPNKGEVSVPSSQNYSGSMDFSSSHSHSVEMGRSITETASESYGESVTYAQALVPQMGESRGARYSLEEQYERRRAMLKTLPTGKAFVRFGDKDPEYLQVIPISEPKTEAEYSAYELIYLRYRQEVFERMLKSKEAMVSEEVDVLIEERQARLRGNPKIVSDDDEDFFQ